MRFCAVSLLVSGRSPYGERGLKSVGKITHCHEICRSPYGERGLKWYRAWNKPCTCESLSLRRAWIEIPAATSTRTRMASLSLRRAWIEILSTRNVSQPITSRSPYGERGLKFFGLCLVCHGFERRSPYGERGLKYLSSCQGRFSTRRSPYGERGLKCG